MTTASETPEGPADLDALVALAQRQHRAGRLVEAAAAYRQILALRPEVAEVYCNLGSVLLAQGKRDEAAAQFERAVALKPGLFQAHNILGDIFLDQGKLERAVAHYRGAIALAPDLAEAHSNLGAALGRQGNLRAAAAHCERAVALKPSLFAAHHNLGNILLKQGDLERAIARYRQTIALAPKFAEAHRNLGDALAQQGKLDEAAACFEQALALRPDYTEAHYNRADLKTFRAGDPDLAALEALAADPRRLPPGKMLYLHFALGKALEDVGDYERAFEHLLEGNALARRLVDYDETAYQQRFRLIADTLDQGLLDRFAAAGDPSTVPIFIVGMPRSGTTLIEQILASHPQVHAAGELRNLTRVVDAVCDAAGQPVPFPQCVSALDADGLRRLGQAYLASLPTLADGKTRITDKMPSNFLFVGLIRLILPNARIVHAMRDPADTCVSCFSKHFTAGHAFSYDLAELGRYYRRYQELMAHWRKVLPAGAMLDVLYEDVVDNLEEQARRLIDYCGLAWDDRCLSFHETSRAIKTPSNAQVRRPLYRSSLARWRRYEAHLGPLLAELELDRA